MPSISESRILKGVLELGPHQRISDHIRGPNTMHAVQNYESPHKLKCPTNRMCKELTTFTLMTVRAGHCDIEGRVRVVPFSVTVDVCGRVKRI